MGKIIALNQRTEPPTMWGLELARCGAVLLTGGLGGVMEAASHGAKDGGGFVVGIVPQDDKRAANDFCAVVIATGLGFARDFLTVYTADAIIIVGGGAGTLIEAAAAYQKNIPIVAMKGTGGNRRSLRRHIP